MKKSKLLGVICIWIGMSQQAIAALIGINDPDMAFLGTAQDGFNITRDTATNLEWLDWSLTLLRSYNDVFNETQGGNLDGWRYATASEFVGLATAAGIPATFLDNTPGGTHPGFAALNLFLGSGSFAGESVAYSATSNVAGKHALGGLDEQQSLFEVPDANEHYFSAVWPDTAINTRVGHALVRATVVPLPPALILFGSGLLGLIGMARRKS